MSDQLKFVDLEWLDSNFPCMAACPVHTEAGRYVALIEEGKYREAYHVARRPNPFASICGRVCAAPCETACRGLRLAPPAGCGARPGSASAPARLRRRRSRWRAKSTVISTGRWAC